MNEGIAYDRSAGCVGVPGGVQGMNLLEGCICCRNVARMTGGAKRKNLLKGIRSVEGEGVTKRFWRWCMQGLER